MEKTKRIWRKTRRAEKIALRKLAWNNPGKRDFGRREKILSLYENGWKVYWNGKWC